MALDLNTVSFLGTAIKLAWEIYDKGFKKEKSSPQRYIEFGTALHGLYSNLKTIESIVWKANHDLESDKLGTFGPKTYDLKPLGEIIGNFRLTLEECRELLNDESKFRQKNGVITNIIYNIDVDEYVVKLTEMLSFHNNKISLVLDPFKLHLQAQLRSLHVETHQDLSERIQALSELVAAGLDIKDGPKSPGMKRAIQVPEAISQKFAAACAPRGQTATEGRMFANFPLKDGLEAFFYHFNGMSPAFDSISYLRLLKSIWIMDQIWQSNDWIELQHSNPGGLYDRCIREMNRKLREECSRVTTSQIPLPELLLQLPGETFSIWPPPTPIRKPTSVTHLGVLLDIPILPDPQTHSLRIVRNIDGTLGVEDTTVTTTESAGTLSSERRIQALNIDPKSAYFVPIYGIPTEAGSSSAGNTIKLQSSRDGVNGVAPELVSSSDLLRLQHLITGYKCVNRRNGVTVASLPDNSGNRQLLEFGNIQMWQRVPYENSSSAAAMENKEMRTTDPGRRLSALSTSPSALKSIGSSMSFSTLGTTSSAHTKQVTLGTSGSIGIQLMQPEPPSLVLFLKEVDSGLLSFLVVELDELTAMNPFSCECGSSKKSCNISVLERKKKPLLARRYYARDGLNSWNLAALGEHWPRELSGATQVNKMYWLRIKFRTEKERIKFNDNVASLVTMFTARMDDYRRDLKSIRGTHIISRRG